MAARKHRLFHAFRISRKLALLSGGLLLVLGVSGTAALVFAPANLIPGYSEQTSGSCRTVYRSAFTRGEEKRLISVISTPDGDPNNRVRTGMRIARHLAQTEHPDLIIVQVMDDRGPTRRAEMRGAAIGAEIVHAPNPSRTLATSKPWEVRYVQALPTREGLYYGPRADMRLLDLEIINREIEVVEGCDGDVVDEEAQSVSHDKPAKTPGH